MEETKLAQAKQKFLRSAEAAAPLNVVRKHPLPSLGAAAVIGALLALPRGKEFRKRLWEFADIALLLARRFVQTSLDEDSKVDK